MTGASAWENIVFALVVFGVTILAIWVFWKK
jgi:hypothetical protein